MLGKRQASEAAANVAKARTRDSMQAFAKLHRARSTGELRIVGDPPLIVPIEDLVAAGSGAGARRGARSRGLVASYRRTLRPTGAICSRSSATSHMARKVVGVGSVGTRAWIVLLLGPRRRRTRCSCRRRRRRRRCSSGSSAERVREPRRSASSTGQRLMQAASDIFLGWQRVDRVSTGGRATTTSASSATGRARRDVDTHARAGS